MKKIKLKKDLYIMGVKTLLAGTEFKVDKYNSRYVYVTFIGCTLRLPRKDVEKIY